MNITKEVMQLSNQYVRGGGKTYRRKQVKRMLAFAAHCKASGIHSLGMVGKKQVVSYWKAHRELSDAIKMQHYDAIKTLWALAEKSTTPPTPFLTTERSDRGEAPRL